MEKNTKVKDKISSYFFKPFLVCLISYFHCLLLPFKRSHQELSKYIKSFQRSFGKKSFSFSTFFLFAI